MSRLSATRAAEEEAEAQFYAESIGYRMNATDWPSWNRSIIARWSMSALTRIKTRAWQIHDQERKARHTEGDPT